MPTKLEDRNYKKEYAAFHGKPEQVAKRASRNAARAKLGRMGKGDGKEVDHKDGNANNNSRKNLRVVSRHANRTKA